MGYSRDVSSTVPGMWPSPNNPSLVGYLVVILPNLILPIPTTDCLISHSVEGYSWDSLESVNLDRKKLHIYVHYYLKLSM